MKRILPALLVTLAALAGVHRLSAQGTAFTYQGRLNDGAGSANGAYDFRFRLAADAQGNTLLGGVLLTNGVPVGNGLFTVTLDFGAGLFTGSNCWLQVDVKTNGAGSYTALAPLQALTPTPYAIMANSASNLLGTLPAGQLTGALPSAQLSGVYGNALTFNNTANTFSGAFTGNFTGNSVTLTNVANQAVQLTALPFKGPAMGFNGWAIAGANNAVYSTLTNQMYQIIDDGIPDGQFPVICIDAGWQGLRDSGGIIHESGTRFPNAGGLAGFVNLAHNFPYRGKVYHFYVGIWQSVQDNMTSVEFPGLVSGNPYIDNFFADTNSALFIANLPNEQALIKDAQTFVSWGIDYVKLESGGPIPIASYSDLGRQWFQTFDAAAQSAGKPLYIMSALGNFWPPWAYGLINAHRSGAYDMPYAGGGVWSAFLGNVFAVAQHPELFGPGSYASLDVFPNEGYPRPFNRTDAMMIMAGMLSSEIFYSDFSSPYGANGNVGRAGPFDSLCIQLAQDPAAIPATFVLTNSTVFVAVKPRGTPFGPSYAVSFLNTNQLPYGKATGVSGSVLADSSQNLTVNAYVGDLIRDIRYGQSTITANTATTITWSGGTFAAGTGDSYEIIDTTNSVTTTLLFTNSYGQNLLGTPTLSGLGQGIYIARDLISNNVAFLVTNSMTVTVSNEMARGFLLTPYVAPATGSPVNGQRGVDLTGLFTSGTLYLGSDIQPVNYLTTKNVNNPAPILSIDQDVNQAGAPIILGADATVFLHGLETYGSQTNSFSLGGKYGRFQATAGFGKYEGAGSTFTFVVIGDGSVLWNSGSVPYSSYSATNIDISVAGVQLLSLGTLCTVGNEADWGNALVTAPFTGDGSELTDLNAANLTGSVPSAALTSVPAGNLTGTIADARLSANVALRAGGNPFTGDQTITAGKLGVGTASLSSFALTVGVPGSALTTTAQIGAFNSGNAFVVTRNTSANVEMQSGVDPLQGVISVVTDHPLVFRAGNGAGAGNNEYMRLHTNGFVGIGTTGPTNKLHVAGGVSATAFVTTSDRNAKENFTAVDAREVLAKVAALPITRWNFKEMRDGPHMGPMAQDFYAAFHLGGSDTTITSIDPDGVALAAIQGLNQKVDEQLRSKDTEIKDLKQSIAELKKMVQSLAEKKLDDANESVARQAAFFLHLPDDPAAEKRPAAVLGLTPTAQNRAALTNATSTGATEMPEAFRNVDFAAAAAKGDAKKGQELFATRGCANCHSIKDGDTGSGGPGLNGIGSRFSLAYIAESVIVPNKSVSPIFRWTLVKLKNGEEEGGLITAESATEIEMLLPSSVRQKIKKADITSRELQNRSPMPEGLILTPAELGDLLAYIAGQK